MKQLLAATALVALTGTAYAASPDTKVPAPATSAAMSTAGGQTFLSAASADDHLATKLMGAPVYENNTANAQSIGTINDIVIDNSGRVQAVIVGVGGFLGIGQKNVALSYPDLQWSMRNSQPVIVATMTKEQLQSAPNFDTAALDTSANGANGNAVADQPMTTNPAAPGLAAPADNGTAMSAPNTQAPDTSAMSDQNATGKATAPVAQVSAQDLMNKKVYSANNKDLGSVGDVILAKDGKIDAMVVDVGGFLGIGQKPVAIAFNGIDIRKDSDGNLSVHTRFTKATLDKAPTYNKDSYTAERNTMRLTDPS